MPGLSDKVCVVEAAKEVFENVTDYEKVISNMVNQNKKSSNKDSFFQNSPLMDQMKSLPCYQEVLLQSSISWETLDHCQCIYEITLQIW